MKQQKKVKQNESLSKQLWLMKKRFNQALTLVGILVMALSLSGCEKLAETAETNGINQTINGAAATESSMPKETVEPPEDGWTLEELLNVTDIYGQTLKLPCTLNDMNENFSYDLQDGLADT
ncbi:MAG: hypothetical protein K2K34_05900, partial [Oscillospiraceae bacterium]|nr:hypothetical protein [Oscillospiraceae bacterium]